VPLSEQYLICATVGPGVRRGQTLTLSAWILVISPWWSTNQASPPQLASKARQADSMGINENAVERASWQRPRRWRTRSARARWAAPTTSMRSSIPPAAFTASAIYASSMPRSCRAFRAPTRTYPPSWSRKRLPNWFGQVPEGYGRIDGLRAVHRAQSRLGRLGVTSRCSRLASAGPTYSGKRTSWPRTA